MALPAEVVMPAGVSAEFVTLISAVADLISPQVAQLFVTTTTSSALPANQIGAVLTRADHLSDRRTRSARTTRQRPDRVLADPSFGG